MALLSIAAVAGGLALAVLSWPGNTPAPASVVNRDGAVYPPPARAAGSAPPAVTQTGCSAVSVKSKSGATAVPGQTVELVAAATGCANPLYRFWVLEPGSRWSMVQDYGVSATYRWTPSATLGDYRFEVDERDASRATAYDAIAAAVFKVAGCTSVNASTDRASPQKQGTRITLKAAASCPNVASYRFWIRAPGGDWRIVHDYSSQNRFAWTPERPGTYDLEVDVRAAGSSARYEAVTNLTYAVT